MKRRLEGDEKEMKDVLLFKGKKRKGGLEKNERDEEGAIEGIPVWSEWSGCLWLRVGDLNE